MKLNVVRMVIRGRQAKRSISGELKRRGGGNEIKDRLVAEGLSTKSLQGALQHYSLNYIYGSFTVKCLLCMKQVSLSRPDYSSLENPQKLHFFSPETYIYIESPGPM
jgi:hypothetical protein